MALKQRAELAIDNWIGDDLIKRLGLHALNNSLHYRAITARFNNQHQLQRGSFQLDGGLCVFILSTVDDVGPMNQLVQSRLFEAVSGGDRVGNELCARLVIRIIKLGRPRSGSKVLFVLRREERALMMIKPPGQPRRRAVLEIDDGVIVAVK